MAGRTGQAYRVSLGDVVFPVTPERIDWSYSARTETVALVNGEEMSLKPVLGLTEVSFEVLLPYWRYPFTHYEGNRFREPQWYLERILQMLSEKTPVMLRVERAKRESRSMLVTLEGYKVKEEAANGLDVLVEIQLREYRAYRAQQLAVQADGTAYVVPQRPGGDDRTVPSQESPVSYTVKKGDTLWMVCQRQYGDGSRCWEIAKKNGIVNPNLIYPGQVIVLD